MRGLLLLALIFCYAINAEDLGASGVDARPLDSHPKDVRRAVASTENVERWKRFQTCNGDGFWEKAGYVVLSLLVKLNC